MNKSVDNTPRILSLEILEDMLEDMATELSAIEADYKRHVNQEGY